jgi:hypothetical protein
MGRVTGLTRRAFVGGVAGLAVLLVSTELVQRTRGRTRLPFVGVISGSDPDTTRQLREALNEGMRQQGSVAGENVIIEWRYALGQTERERDLVAELIQKDVDLLVVSVPIPGLRAARDLIGDLPVVLVDIADPVGCTPSGWTCSKKRFPASRVLASFGFPTHSASSDSRCKMLQSAWA